MSHSPTMSRHVTEAGMIMGTAAYMSPEQARGKPVDKRADIWAFGVVLFEMMTVRRLFAGETTSDTLAAVLRQDVDWAALPAGTTRSLRRLLERCLERDVKRRLQAIGEARIALDSPDAPIAPDSADQRSTSRSSTKTRLLAWSGVALIAAGAAAAGWFVSRSRLPAPAVSRLLVSLPVPLSPDIDDADIAVAPDGRALAYVGRNKGTDSVYVRPLDQLEFRALAGTEGARNLVFSPDGAWIAFFAGGTLKKIPAAGGSATLISEGHPDAFSLEWGKDGSLVFVRGFTLGLARVAASGGDVEILALPDASKGESSLMWPAVLPGSSDLLVVVNPENIATFDDAKIAVESIERKGSRETLPVQGSFPHYLATGHLLFATSGSLMAAPFDLRQRKVTGAAVPVVDGVSVAANSGAVQAAISESGTLIYAPIKNQDPKRRLVVVDSSGAAQPLSDFLPHAFREFSLSADGQRVAVTVAKANDDIHIFDVSRASLTRFTSEGGDQQNPVWTPDSSRVAYRSQRGGTPAMYWRTVAGNATPEKILEGQYPQRPSSFSPDGRILAYTEANPKSGSDIWTVRLDAGKAGRPESFLRTPFEEELPVFSPDGKWIAYRSDESGRQEVYVAQFPGAAIKQQISIGGGDQPAWAASGRQLLFLNENRVMSVDLTTASALLAGKPRMLFERDLRLRGNSQPWRRFAVFPDGRRFLFIEDTPLPEVRELVVVLNWFEELKRTFK